MKKQQIKNTVQYILQYIVCSIIQEMDSVSAFSLLPAPLSFTTDNLLITHSGILLLLDLLLLSITTELMVILMVQTSTPPLSSPYVKVRWMRVFTH